MAILSSFAIIRGLCLFHITMAYFLLTAPRILADQNLVFLFGEAMNLPEPTAFVKPSSATAFAAIILALLGISDLVAVSAEDEVAYPYWSNQLPIRLLFLFSLTAYTYMFKPGGMAATSGINYHYGAGDHIKNRVVFTWGFFECAMWFWAYLIIRDERRQVAMRLIEKRKAEAESFQ